MRDDGTRAPPGGAAEAGAAATRVLDDGTRAPPSGSAQAGAAMTNVREAGERAPPGGSVLSWLVLSRHGQTSAARQKNIKSFEPSTWKPLGHATPAHQSRGLGWASAHLGRKMGLSYRAVRLSCAWSGPGAFMVGVYALGPPGKAPSI